MGLAEEVKYGLSEVAAADGAESGGVGGLEGGAADEGEELGAGVEGGWVERGHLFLALGEDGPGEGGLERDLGVAEGGNAVYPIGKPIHHSANADVRR